MNTSNFIIDRAYRGALFSPSTGEVNWSVTQVEEPSLSITTENEEKLDAIGVKLAILDRAKAVEFSAQNSLFDFGLAAAQFGTEKQVATADKKLTVEKWEERRITAEEATAKKIVLAEAPVGTAGAEIPFIYLLNGDRSVKERFTIGTTASATVFALDTASKTITYPTGLVAGDVLWIPYFCESEKAVILTNTAKDFPKAGRFVLEVLGHDVCDENTLCKAYVELPHAKLKGDVDMDFTTEGKHPFTIEALQDYCDYEKKLVVIKIVG